MLEIETSCQLVCAKIIGEVVCESVDLVLNAVVLREQL